MNNVEKYDALFESINEKFINGELTEEQATMLNDAAYAKYVEAYEEPEFDAEEVLASVEESVSNLLDSVNESVEELIEESKKSKKKDKEECDCGEEDCPICNPKKEKADDEVEEDGEEGDDANGGDPPEQECAESVDINEVKLHVYEAFDEGRISEDEKAMFLACLD